MGADQATGVAGVDDTVVDGRGLFHGTGPAAVVPTAVGVIAPYDMALDRELWRWVPDDVSLLFTRTPYAPLEVTMEMADRISCPDTVVASTRSVAAVSPAACVYACTTGSFSRGLSGELELVAHMQSAGAPAAITTSGALVGALAQLGVGGVALATPYDEEVTGRLAAFLAECGHEVTRFACLEMHRDIWTVPYDVTARLVREADGPAAEAVVVSCTNLPTYDLIAPLEAELGKPVITANQATMWAAMAAVGRHAVGPGQSLVQRGAPASPGSCGMPVEAAG